jgi:hypothetical protein
MPARTTISPNDGESTPVAHTFVPHGDVSNGVAAFRNLNATNVAASEMLTIGTRESLAKPEDYQVPGKVVSPRKWQMKATLPKTFVDSVSGLTLVSRANTMKVESLIHPMSTQQECKNLRFIVGNMLLGTTMVQDTHDLGIPLW